MARDGNRPVVDAVRGLARPWTGAREDDSAFLDLVGDARLVLLGEASHGTHEFYEERARLTRRLIEEKGFHAVAVEADWPDAYRVNCYVQGRGSDADANVALGGFRRFPTWMWRNTVVREFVEWLRSYNQSSGRRQSPVGFYGLDLYSLYSSLEAVIDYLARIDPDAARRARERYACFEHFGRDSQAYGYATSYAGAEPCEDEVVAQLRELRQRTEELVGRDGQVAEDDYFYAEQNARLAKNAEEYYRSMFRGRTSSWNLRDCHMGETLDELVAHLNRRVGRAKIVIWAHNSHIGDARATEMGRRGELNVGQLARERFGPDAVLIGFSTYQGTVTAATDWGDPPERKRVRPGLTGSFEEVFHEVGLPRFLLPLRQRNLPADLETDRLQRAIGVIYRPETERFSHYFDTRLPQQFDAILHYDETRAVEPLERSAAWERGEAAETYPSGL